LSTVNNSSPVREASSVFNLGDSSVEATGAKVPRNYLVRAPEHSLHARVHFSPQPVKRNRIIGVFAVRRNPPEAEYRYWRVRALLCPLSKPPAALALALAED
jgi:hypothetical protein